MTTQLLQTVHGLCLRLPEDAALALGRGLGTLAHGTVRRRRRIALANLRTAFGDDRDEAELQEICRAHFRHLGAVAAEFLRLPRLTPAALLERFTVSGLDQVRAAQAQDRGVVLVTAHIGNWEWLCAAQAALGLKVAIVTRHAHVTAVDRFWQSIRATHGVEFLDDAGTLGGIMRRLRKGCTIGLAIDQHEGGTTGARVPFFGREAGTTKTPALLAARAGCPVLPAWSWRDAEGRHHATFGPPLPLIKGRDLDETVDLTTRGYNTWLEGIIREHPKQWLWLHRRWKAP